MELIAIMLLTLVLAPLVKFTTGVPGMILAAVFLLFFPGYSLVAALFPGRDSLQAVERAFLSLVLSFAMVALTGLALNYTPWGIRLEPIYVVLAFLVFVASIIALFRRRRLLSWERFEPRIHLEVSCWRDQSPLDRALSIGLVLAVMGAIAALVCVIASPKAEESFTDFYLLGAEGMMEHYPQEVVLSEGVEVTLVIKNHENQDTGYNVTVMFDGESVQAIGPIALGDEEEWREAITLVPARAGEDQKVEFLLYKKGEGGGLYLTLYLWLDVKE